MYILIPILIMSVKLRNQGTSKSFCGGNFKGIKLRFPNTRKPMKATVLFVVVKCSEIREIVFFLI